MPQQTNLNVAPYFDNFDPTNEYQKVLFKPGYPVQARELTTLQSILQNQVEKFGQHFFKEGAKVIPGNTGYSQLYYAVQLSSTFQGVPVEAYASQLIGSTITGQTSGITATVDNVLFSADSERGNLTLYVAYVGSSTADNTTQTFFDGEELTSNQIISSGLFGNSTIAPGTPFATTIINGAAATGSVFQIDSGVYFIRGHFVSVNKESLILDQYSNTPSYRVGLFVNEEIVNSNADESLNDNSQGFNNYGAPGADRLRMSVSLFKKSLSDKNDDNFIELATIENGNLKTSQTRRGSAARGNGGVFYDDLTDILAKRTYDESGHYIVKPFNVSIVNSLNNNRGNQGVFQAGQFTYSGGTPSDDLALCRISPGKAYVRGYEIETVAPTFIDVPKPRTTKTVEDQFIEYNTGPTFKLNNVYRTPSVGVGNTFVVSLRSDRVGSDPEVASGKEVGLARVFDFRLDSGSYDASLPDTNEWGISLFDVQSFTEIAVNQNITLSTPAYVEGDNSGATAFLRSSVNVGTALTVYDKKGEFLKDEKLIFRSGTSNDKITESRVAVAITSHDISDVKSLFGDFGVGASASGDNRVGINTFSADVVQSSLSSVGIVTITATSGGNSVVRGTNPAIPGIFKEGNLVRFTQTSSTSDDKVLAKVSGVGTDSITISQGISIPGVCDRLDLSTLTTVTDFELVTTNFDTSSDNTLFTRFPKEHIATVDLTEATLIIRKTFTVNITNGQLSAVSITDTTLPEGQIYLPFTSTRYSLIRSNGVTEPLTRDKIAFSSDGKVIRIRNLGADDTGAKLIVTVSKSKVKSKKKLVNGAKSLVVNKSTNPASGVGSTTINDGLDYGNYAFGTRVQDKIISLNTPDIIEIHGIYESSDPTLDDASFGAPQMSLTQMNGVSGTTADVTLGELFVGQSSGAAAVHGEFVNNTTIRYLAKNNFGFVEGETVIFQETGIQGVIGDLTTTSFDLTTNYTFNAGQKDTFFDFGTLRRKDGFDSPTSKIKIYFKSASFDTTDDGDIVTVESYNDFNYSTEVKGIKGVLNTDLIDLRPRVSDYSITENSRSPLEFLGRSFDSVGSSIPNILASNENIFLDYSYFQSRIDRLFLHKDGKFQFKFGTPSDDPTRSRPEPVDNAIEIAEITYPPYLHNVEQASIKFLKYKRFQMKDIKKLEDRIKNLEYYTQLSLLETNTANMLVLDENGTNRFKSGFFVDNFTSFKTQETGIEKKNSIDQIHKHLRAKHFTTSVDLQTGPVVNVDENEDKRTSPIEGINVRKQSDIISLEHSEEVYIEQSFATRTESVTPFLISFWQGTITLTPSSDTWIDQTRISAKTIDTMGNYAMALAAAEEQFGIDPQTGFSGEVWNSWENDWSGTYTYEIESIQRNEYSEVTFGRGGWINGDPASTPAQWVRQSSNQVVEDDKQHTIESGEKTRTGIQHYIVEEFENVSVGDKVVSSEVVKTVRSRNVEFYATNLKPSTRIYAFFDGRDVTNFCVPKLLEIRMTSGTFEVGERVVGTTSSTTTSDSERSIRFRVAQSNHRRGDYNAPDEIYSDDPYAPGGLIPANYSSTSTILNVDTYSLSNQPQGEYYGYVTTGMTLKGVRSGATAEIINVRLISDNSSALGGSFYIPESRNRDNPTFETGSNVFTLTNNADNDQNAATTVAEEAYATSGLLETVQDQILSIRNARVESKKLFQSEVINRTVGTEIVDSRNIGEADKSEEIVGYYDPLAQSFEVKDATGVFVTKCDVFFRTKDDGNTPIRFQIRTMKNGFPTAKYFDLSEVILHPEDVLTSTDGSVATTFEFAAPVYLEGGNEYAICLISNSTKYSVYISRVGENDILSDTFISNQPTLGSLFKSQNASTWEASQWEDLKFTMYRAEFVESGSIDLYNPELSEGNKQVATLLNNPLNVISNQIRVGLGTTLADNRYQLGNTFFQAASDATGDLVGVAASATGTLSITNPGIGYTPGDGSFTFSDVNLVTVTGDGSGATAEVSIADGVAVAATITGNGGNGYQVGDVVSISAIGEASIGRNARFTLTSIGHTSQLLLDNVQGEFITGAAGTISFFDANGVARELNNGTFNGTAFGGDVTIPSTGITSVTDGLHVKVNHKNHGMYFADNFVRISGVLPDIKPVKLTAPYSVSSTDPIQLSDGSIFSTFENVGIGTTNTGLLLIGDEVIEYTSTTSSSVGGNITRGINNTLIKSYPIDTPVYKYELGGVNLSRINKTHDLQDVSISDPITLDSYHIKLDMSQKYGSLGINNNADRSTGQSYPKLFIGGSKSTGGETVTATQNIPFEMIKPSIHNVSVEGTSISGQIRTITSQSISGTEIPYVNTGFEDITLNANNYLDSPRAIFSKVNEDRKLDFIEGNKSLQMRLFLNTTNTKLSPQIELQRCNVITTSNRINSVISNYATDSRVNSVESDPTACQYISKEIVIENPATSLKVILDAHINASADIRAFYAINNDSGSEPIFTPFPGHLNINSRGFVIDEKDNDGRSNKLVTHSNKDGFGYTDCHFKEYVFEVDRLPSFRTYRIKIVMTSTSQVFVPRMRDLRALALA